MKRLLAVMMLLAVSAGAGMAADWGDSFTITVTPAGDRGVIIDTTSISVTLTMATTVQINDPVPVTSTGTIADLEYTLSGTDSMGAWDFSADGNTGANTIAVHALFNSTKPTLADFDLLKHLITTSPLDAGNAGAEAGAGAHYEGDVDVDNLALNVTRNLWLQLKAPTSTSSGSAQPFSITISAEAAD